jgi:urease subunit gamma
MNTMDKTDRVATMTRDDVMEGVADMISRVQLEAVFDAGSRLITAHSPIQ